MPIFVTLLCLLGGILLEKHNEKVIRARDEAFSLSYGYVENLRQESRKTILLEVVSSKTSPKLLGKHFYAVVTTTPVRVIETADFSKSRLTDDIVVQVYATRLDAINGAEPLTEFSDYAVYTVD